MIDYKMVNKKMKDYATIKKGKVKFEIGSPQDKFLHTKNLPHTHVHFVKVGKTIKKKMIRYQI